MPETTAAAHQDDLIARYIVTACDINDLQWEGIMVRVLRYGLDKQTLAIVGAITACASHAQKDEPGFDAEMKKALRLAGPKVWLQVLQALASRDGEQDRVVYYTVAPLYYLTMAIVMTGDNIAREALQAEGGEDAKMQPSWWHNERY